MDLKKELWDKLTQLEEKKQGKADTYYDILALFNVVGRSEQLHVENACKCENKQTFNRLQCPKCKPL